MAKYRKKPVVIEAMQWTGGNLSEVFDFANERAYTEDATLLIRTAEGPLTASVNDWIIKGVKGEFYPCKPDIFAVTYDPVT